MNYWQAKALRKGHDIVVRTTQRTFKVLKTNAKEAEAKRSSWIIVTTTTGEEFYHADLV
jgi:hypothetical protein